MSYTEQEKDEMLHSQCFNNSCTMVALWFGKDPVMSVKAVFTLAEQLYDEAVRRDWRHYGKKAVSSALTTGSNHLTDKEGKEMDPDFKNKELIM